MAEWEELPLPDEVLPLERAVKQAALRVHRALGPGFREAIYRRALAHALRRDGYDVVEEVWLDVEFEGLRMAHAVRADMIVANAVLVELKAVQSLHPVDREQVVSYLKASGLTLGLLFNFNCRLLMKTGYERLVHPSYLVKLPELGFSGARVLGSRVDARDEPR